MGSVNTCLEEVSTCGERFTKVARVIEPQKHTKVQENSMIDYEKAIELGIAVSTFESDSYIFVDCT